MIYSQFATFIILAFIWVNLSNELTPIMLSLGALSACITLIFINRMRSIEQWEKPNSATFYMRFFVHFLTLLGPMLKSGLTVALTTLKPRLEINSAFIMAPSTQKNALTQLMRVNSITLTPGTISTELFPAWISVHALNLAPNEDSEQKRLDQQISALEQR